MSVSPCMHVRVCGVCVRMCVVSRCGLLCVCVMSVSPCMYVRVCGVCVCVYVCCQ